MYLPLKYAHLALAIVSISGFVLRGLWMMSGSALLGHKAVRIAPHVVDTPRYPLGAYRPAAMWLRRTVTVHGQYASRLH